VVSKGKLTGYRWGLERKKALLTWELSRKDPLEMPF
jgi:O6-methylguanine-DNA--protein-cysteine methyltransferase